MKKSLIKFFVFLAFVAILKIQKGYPQSPNTNVKHGFDLKTTSEDIDQINQIFLS